MENKIDSIIREMNKRAKESVVQEGLPEYHYKKIPFTSPRMNYCTFGGLPIGKMIEFYGEEHGGKALAMDCKVLTPNGYTKMKNIHKGDYVIDGNGEATQVIGVYPQGVKDMVRITFSDHTSVKCSTDHLWSVYRHKKNGTKTELYTISTKEIMKNYKVDPSKTGRSFYYYSIPTPIIKDIDCHRQLKINPYLLGILIADGSLCGNFGICLHEKDVKERVEQLLNEWDMTLKQYSSSRPYDYAIVYRNKVIHNQFTDGGLKGELKALGLLCKSVDKHIPKEYLYTSVENRLLLLQGLFDGDGYSSKEGKKVYTTSSKQLSEDFAFLVRSLGARDYIHIKPSRYKGKDGNYINCAKSYSHGIVFKNGIIPCSSLKHMSRYNSNRNFYDRKIINIEIIEPEECQCIKVDSEYHTFIVENEIVTHNTTTALDIIANYQNMEDARKVLYCDCENTLDAEWAHKLGVDTDSMIVMKPTSQSAEEIFQFILDMVETGEIGLFVIDSLGAMVSQQELEKSVEEKTYAGISKPLTVFGRKAEMLMQRTQCTGIGINQIREDLNSTWGGITTPGGKAWKHICSVRMQFSRGKFIDEKGNELTRSAETPVGNIVQMSITKIKSAPPTRRVGFYTLNYETGIDYLKDLVDVAIKYGIVIKKGAWFDIVDIETGEVIKNSIQGQANVYSYLEENTDVLERIEKKIDEFITMN